LIAPVIKIRCLFDLFTEKKKSSKHQILIFTSPTKMNMKTKLGENINTVTKKKPHQTNNSNETSVEHLLYIGLFLVTVDVISKYSLPIQHEVIFKKMADVLPVHLTINVENTLFILHILENNYRFVKLECSILELVNYEQIKNHHLDNQHR
jgi:hypothetical protein